LHRSRLFCASHYFARPRKTSEGKEGERRAESYLSSLPFLVGARGERKKGSREKGGGEKKKKEKRGDATHLCMAIVRRGKGLGREGKGEKKGGGGKKKDRAVHSLL